MEEPVRVRNHFFVLHERVLCHHLDVVGAESIRDLAREDLMVRAPDDLAGRQVEDLLETPVDEQEATVEILHVDDGGGIVGDIV